MPPLSLTPVFRRSPSHRAAGVLGAVQAMAVVRRVAAAAALGLALPAAAGAAAPHVKAKTAVAPKNGEARAAPSTLAERPRFRLLALDGRGRSIDLERSHASLSRTLPPSLRPKEERHDQDSDALRWVIVGREPELASEISVTSSTADGRKLDAIEGLPLAPAPCPAGTPPDLRCRATALVRATMDWLDRSHPRASEPALRAEVGGRLRVASAGVDLGSIRVGGPRETRLGALERYRARLRVRVLRTSPGAGVAVGSDVSGGLEVVRRELASANALWGQCGIQFGGPDELDVDVVDPPPPHMFSVGCGFGLPAAGGSIAVRVGNQRIEWRTQPGERVERVARGLAQRIERAGFRVAESPNPRESFAAQPSLDLLVRGAKGEYVPLEIATTKDPDPSLEVCLGSVNLSDGLRHFADSDAATGTLEERTLLKAIADADPSTIDVLVVPYFVTVGRIGESFVDGGGLGVRNAIIIDRAGVRAGARSFALAHELGHVLLQVAGHPDDFGTDLPTSLMDGDAADSSVFGPRRLSVAECERAVLQSGPKALLPLLDAWPIER